MIVSVEDGSEGQLRPSASILHVDMDSFFVSVELLDRPDLRGRPAVVANDTARSVVSSASYEARKYGVRSAMPIGQAKRLCPDLILLEHHMDKYRDASREVMEIFREFTPLVEPLSIDEAFLDVAGATRLFGPPRSIAEQLRVRIRDRTGLPASVGLAGTKHVAKLASQRAKPDGILEIHPTRTQEFLHGLPVSAIWGVGAATAQALERRAIRTVGQLADESLESLRRIVGVALAHKLYDLARGRDTREVVTHRVEKSIGREETFAIDEQDPHIITRELLRLSTQVASQLRSRHLEAKTLAVKVRWSNFETLSRSKTIAEATGTSQRIYQTVRDLYHVANPSGRAVRLIGVRAEQLVEAGSDQAALWSDDDSWRAVDHAVDDVRNRFGKLGLTPARLLLPHDATGPNSRKQPSRGEHGSGEKSHFEAESD